MAAVFTVFVSILYFHITTIPTANNLKIKNNNKKNNHAIFKCHRIYISFPSNRDFNEPASSVYITICNLYAIAAL